jgi:hypothetical protein
MGTPITSLLSNSKTSQVSEYESYNMTHKFEHLKYKIALRVIISKPNWWLCRVKEYSKNKISEMTSSLRHHWIPNYSRTGSDRLYLVFKPQALRLGQVKKWFPPNGINPYSHWTYIGCDRNPQSQLMHPNCPGKMKAVNRGSSILEPVNKVSLESSYLLIGQNEFSNFKTFQMRLKNLNSWWRHH